MTRSPLPCVLTIMACCAAVAAQGQTEGPARDVEQVVEEASRTPEAPLSTVDRPIYRGLQEWKRELNEKHGINWALEDTLVYQAASGGVDPNDAMVNTLGLFATWKLFRNDNGKDYGGIGFQGETRG